MKPENFCYWMMGFFEVADPKEINEEQTKMIKRHLALVFKHEIDPSLGGDQKELQAIHDGSEMKEIMNTFRC